MGVGGVGIDGRGNDRFTSRIQVFKSDPVLKPASFPAGVDAPFRLSKYFEPTEQSFKFTSLKPATQYYITVQACIGVRWTPWYVSGAWGLLQWVHERWGEGIAGVPVGFAHGGLAGPWPPACMAQCTSLATTCGDSGSSTEGQHGTTTLQTSNQQHHPGPQVSEMPHNHRGVGGSQHQEV